jgi:hypothetical protein
MFLSGTFNCEEQLMHLDLIVIPMLLFWILAMLLIAQTGIFIYVTPGTEHSR